MKQRVLSLTHDGHVYNLRPEDFTAADDLAIFRAVGVDIHSIFYGGSVTLFTICALVWRYRVTHGHPDETFTDFASTFKYTDMQSVAEGEKEGGPPEVPDGDS